MNAVIPKKRRDGKSSFEDLVSYVSVRDDMTDEELDLSSSSQAEQPPEAVSVALLIMRHVFEMSHSWRWLMS